MLEAAAGGTRPLTGPLRVQWDITFNCNSRCLTCRRWSEKHSPDEELSTAEARSLLRQLAENDVLNVSFAGNEPLLRHDIFELIACARELGLTTSMNTNALLIDEQMAARICESGLDMVYLSLDGPNEEINDVIRGVKGAFRKTIRAAELMTHCQGKRPKVMVNTVANRRNLSGLVQTAESCRRLGFDGMLIQPLHYFQKQFESGDDLHFRPEDMPELAGQLAVIKKDFKDFVPLMPEYFDRFVTFYRHPDELYRYRCLAAYAALDIRPNGDFAPCPAWDLRLGNFREVGSFREFWHSDTVQDVRQRIKGKEHPICWFACIIPMNLMLSYLHPLKWPSLLNPSLLRHVLRKV